MDERDNDTDRDDEEGEGYKEIGKRRQDNGEEMARFSFHAMVNKTPSRWTVIEPKNSDTFNLSPGVQYRVTLWGNNGFARTTKWSGPLLVPSTFGR